MRVVGSLFVCLLAAHAARAAQAPTPYSLCETAITTAEYTARLPNRLLGSIAQVESGRFDEIAASVRPWPWTINAEGSGQFFANKNDAISAVKALQARGVQSIDVGCMQVNLMYHPDAFASLDEAFDPLANTRYAAKFLNILHASDRDWSHAIGAYHSETPALGEAYRTLVMLRWGGAPTPMAPELTQSSAYQAFRPTQEVYGAFAPSSLTYGSSPVPPFALLPVHR